MLRKHLIVPALLLLVISCGKKDEQNNPVLPTIDSMQTIAGAPDRRGLVGQNVNVPSAQAQKVVGNYVFWAGDEHNQIPVVRGDKMKQGAVKDHVRLGDRVKIVGTVRLLEGVPENDPMWDQITPTERAEINTATVYVLADAVEVLH